MAKYWLKSDHSVVCEARGVIDGCGQSAVSMMEVASGVGWPTHGMPVNHFVLLWEPIPEEKPSSVAAELEAMAGKFDAGQVLARGTTHDLLHRAAAEIRNLREMVQKLRDTLRGCEELLTNNYVESHHLRCQLQTATENNKTLMGKVAEKGRQIEELTKQQHVSVDVPQAVYALAAKFRNACPGEWVVIPEGMSKEQVNFARALADSQIEW